MSIMTMATPSPYHHTFRSDLTWDVPRPSPTSSRPRTESKQVALPSIRQTFPDLHLETSLANVASDRSSHFKPSPSIPGPLSSPEYVHSPNGKKKRRISNEDEQEYLRSRQVPRLYRSPEAHQHRAVSPRSDYQSSSKDRWGRSPTRSTTYGPDGALPPPVEITSRPEQRQGLPSLPPSLKYDADPSALHRSRAPTVDSIRAAGTSSAAPSMDRAAYHHSQSQSQDYGYPYHHPSRFQSLSTSSIRSHDRGPFSAGAYGSHYQDMARYGDIGINGDTKQRKRRGNLPKETTDKLRTWFVTHLQHPYPTEDEKQDLMRSTGLQMNQISNWFINARRRQLPTMINNARAESDAMNGRSCDGSVLASTEHGSEYGGKRDDGLPLSDSEGGVYDDDLNSIRQRRGGQFERESV
ncbi:homeodomain super [Conoideocrella luteorostrata]|uniref:Homeodomain super n=1 Tax=Conoideocrella luteorostrata TaxID=1105319 RepID=A0AAJ0FVC0_9HYPO|nr:homeodomain super [Conoideocrella luteorostrata]